MRARWPEAVEPGEESRLWLAILSAETARSKLEDGGPREDGRLEGPLEGPAVAGPGISKALIGRELEPEASGLSWADWVGLLGTGVFVPEIQMPSTSMPLWIARIPNGMSSPDFLLGAAAASTI